MCVCVDGNVKSGPNWARCGPDRRTGCHTATAKGKSGLEERPFEGSAWNTPPLAGYLYLVPLPAPSALSSPSSPPYYCPSTSPVPFCSWAASGGGVGGGLEGSLPIHQFLRTKALQPTLPIDLPYSHTLRSSRNKRLLPAKSEF